MISLIESVSTICNNNFMYISEVIYFDWDLLQYLKVEENDCWMSHNKGPKLQVGKSVKGINFQHSLLDDHLLRIYLIKNIAKENHNWGKKKKKPNGKGKKSSIFLHSFWCLLIVPFCKGKPSGRNLSEGKRVKLAHIPLSFYSPSGG